MMTGDEVRNYNHWFWNGFIIRNLSKIAGKINVWCWQKQYNRKN